MSLPKELTTVTRFSKFFALFLFVALPFLTFLFGMNARRVPKIVKLHQKSTPSPTLIYTSPPRIPLPLVYSTNADYVVRPEISPQKDGSYELVFTIRHRAESTELVTQDIVHTDTQNSILWKEKVNDMFKRRLDRFAKEYEPLAKDGRPDLATWSSDDKKIALYLPDKIVIMDVSIHVAEKETEGHTYNHHIITVDKSDSIQIPILDASIYDPELFFSGDGSELYYKSSPDTFQYQRIDLSTLIVSNVDVSYPYPIPRSKGFVYWEKTDSYEQHTMVVYTGDTKKRYTIKQSFDYADKILLSPQKDNVCFENGSSGYHGYTIYSLERNVSIDTGIQYSYCVKWIDNNTVILKETPYSFPEYTQYFTYNIQTKQKTLLTQEKSVY